MSEVFRVLDHQLDAVKAGGAADYELIEAAIDYCKSYADQWHHPTEDLVYAALDREPGAPGEVSRDLHEEHRQLSRTTDALHEMIEDVLGEGVVSRQKLVAAVERFLSEYRAHMSSEERFLFPIARSTLTEKAWDGIEAHSERIADPLFGAQVADRYKALAEHIQALDRISIAPEESTG